MIRTQRRGRWGKWHKAGEWKSNDVFWMTACGMAVFKRSSLTMARGCDSEPMCERCRESLQPDTSYREPDVRAQRT